MLMPVTADSREESQQDGDEWHDGRGASEDAGGAVRQRKCETQHRS